MDMFYPHTNMYSSLHVLTGFFFFFLVNLHFIQHSNFLGFHWFFYVQSMVSINHFVGWQVNLLLSQTHNLIKLHHNQLQVYALIYSNIYM